MENPGGPPGQDPNHPNRANDPNDPNDPNGMPPARFSKNKRQPQLADRPRPEDVTRTYPEPRLLRERRGEGGSATDDEEVKNLEAAAMEAEDPCSICQEKLPDEERGILKCGHAFCFACVHTWTKTESQCPTCRAKVSFIVKTLSPKDLERKEARQERLEKRIANRELNRAQRKRERRKIALFKNPRPYVHTKVIRVRPKSQRATALAAQRRAPHPQAPGGFMYEERMRAIALRQQQQQQQNILNSDLQARQVDAVVRQEAAMAQRGAAQSGRVASSTVANQERASPAIAARPAPRVSPVDASRPVPPPSTSNTTDNQVGRTPRSSTLASSPAAAAPPTLSARAAPARAAIARQREAARQHTEAVEAAAALEHPRALPSVPGASASSVRAGPPSIDVAVGASPGAGATPLTPTAAAAFQEARASRPTWRAALNAPRNGRLSAPPPEGAVVAAVAAAEAAAVARGAGTGVLLEPSLRSVYDVAHQVNEPGTAGSVSSALGGTQEFVHGTSGIYSLNYEATRYHPAAALPPLSGGGGVGTSASLATRDAGGGSSSGGSVVGGAGSNRYGAGQGTSMAAATRACLRPRCSARIAARTPASRHREVGSSGRALSQLTRATSQTSTQTQPQAQRSSAPATIREGRPARVTRSNSSPEEREMILGGARRSGGGLGDRLTAEANSRSLPNPGNRVLGRSYLQTDNSHRDPTESDPNPRPSQRLRLN